MVQSAAGSPKKKRQVWEEAVEPFAVFLLLPFRDFIYGHVLVCPNSGKDETEIIPFQGKLRSLCGNTLLKLQVVQSQNGATVLKRVKAGEIAWTPTTVYNRDEADSARPSLRCLIDDCLITEYPVHIQYW